ncbi:MAG TPA: hypothetical protein VFD58_07855 [Blastocatellia bacterium]|nr:hypothetical protein [Blastocatellia bacterium]
MRSDGKTADLELTSSETAQISTMIEECLKAMRQANEEMARDQQEIERLKARTAARLDELKKGGWYVEAIL